MGSEMCIRDSSAIVKIVEQYGKDAAGPVKKYVEEMVAAVRKA